MGAMRSPGVILVNTDHAFAAILRTVLAALPRVAFLVEVRTGVEPAREAACLSPTAILVATNLPGRLLTPLVRDLRAASDRSKLVVIADRAPLDSVTLRALLDAGVTGCLAWEDAPPDVLPHYLSGWQTGECGWRL